MQRSPIVKTEMPGDLVTPGSSRDSESPMDIQSDQFSPQSRSQQSPQQQLLHHQQQQHQQRSPQQQPERAHRACEKCTRTKKKCDKALPACSRCTRLTTACCYDFVYTAPATSVVEPTSLAGYLSGPKNSEQSISKPPVPSILDPNLDISAGMIMALLTSRNINWRDSTELYFRTMHPSLAIVHPERFTRRVEGLGTGDLPKEPEVALLVVCMQLVTQYINSNSAQMSEGREMMTLPAYIIAKRVFTALRGQSSPSITLVQCGILLCLFEFGHGDVIRAYITLGDAVTLGKFLRLRPGKYVEMERDMPVTPEDEERRSLFWALFVIDRLMHVESQLMWMPLQAPTPVEDDLLPTTNVVWDNQSQTPVATFQKYPANVSPSVVLGPFQRLSQCAMLLTRALVWELKTYEPNSPATMESFSELDVATRTLIEAMLMQSSHWGEYFECFSTCTCLLLLLYRRYLRTVDSSNIHSDTSNVEVLKAISAINFTVRIITDTTTDLNNHLARRPDLLAPCSPVTPYSAFHCLHVLSTFEHVIQGADARFHQVYSSLHFFAKRWGVAGQLVHRIETFLAEKDEGMATEPDFPVPDASGEVPFV